MLSTSESTAAGPEPAAPAPSDRPFFVVGSGRSGTTLLRLMLSGHPRLHVSPETWFLQPLLAELPVGRTLTTPEQARAIAIITSHYRWPDLGLTDAALAAELPPTAHLRDITDAVYRLLARDAGKRRIGDKTPVYVTILPQLAALYPDAQIIHLLRDGRDVALSLMDAGWKHRCYEGSAFEWTAAVRAARAYARRAEPRTWHEIRYEDLVRDPEPVVRDLCAFLGEAFDPAMLDASARANLVPERERKIHKLVSGPIDANRAGAWATRLKPLELFVMEACLGPELRACGYPLRYTGVWTPILPIGRALLLAAGPLLMRGIPALKRRGFVPDKARL